MRALRTLRYSCKANLPGISPAAISAPSPTPTNIDVQSLLKSNDDRKDSKQVPFAAFAATAAAVATPLTPAGYAIPPVGVTVLSNLPLAAFFYVQLSGLSPIRQILKDKATGELSPFPFISMITNCAIWTLYGVLQSDQTIIVANAMGVVAGAAYTAIFAKHTHQSMMKYYAGSGAILATFLSSPMWAEALGTDATTVLGTFGMSTAVVLMASPLAVVGTVIKNKSTAALPFPVSLAMTLNGACWGSYGLFVTNDLYVWLPNVLGFGAGVLQLSLFAIYS